MQASERIVSRECGVGVSRGRSGRGWGGGLEVWGFSGLGKEREGAVGGGG